MAVIRQKYGRSSVSFLRHREESRDIRLAHLARFAARRYYRVGWRQLAKRTGDFCGSGAVTRTCRWGVDIGVPFDRCIVVAPIARCARGSSICDAHSRHRTGRLVSDDR